MIPTTFTLSADLFEVNAGDDVHVASNWDILDGSTVIWSSSNDTVNLTSIEVPLSAVVANKAYRGRVQYKGQKNGWSRVHLVPIMVSYRWASKLVAVASTLADDRAGISASVYSERAFTLRAAPPKGTPNMYTSSGTCTAFTHDGKVLLVGHTAAPFMSMYVRNRDGLARSNGPSPFSAVQGIACNPDNIVAYTTISAPFIRACRIENETSVDDITIDTPLPGAGTGITFSSDGRWLAVASGVSPHLSVYEVDGKTLKKRLDSGNAITSTHTPRTVTFNHDNSTITVATSSTTYTFNFNGASLVRKTSNVISRVGAVSIDYNPQGTHAVGGYGAGNRFEIYPILANGNVGTGSLLAGSPTTGSATGCRFSPDGQTMVVSFEAAPHVRMYKLWEGEYIPAVNPTVAPNSASYMCKYSADGGILAVGMSTSPFIAFYKRDGDLFVRQPSPTVLPTASVRGIDIDGDIITVAPSMHQYRIVPDDKVVHDLVRINYINDGTISAVERHSTLGTVTTAIGSSTTTKVYEDTSNVDVITQSDDIVPEFHQSTSPGRTHAISKDGNYLAVSMNGESPNIKTYVRNGSQFELMGDLSPNVTGRVKLAEMNDDGSLLVLVTDLNTLATVVYKRVGNRYELDSEFQEQYHQETNRLKISNTEEFLVVSTVSSTAAYRRVAGSTRQRVFYTTEFTNTAVQSIAFTVDDKYMAIACQTAPFLKVYDTSDFSELAVPGPALPGAGRSVSWSPTSDRLVVVATALAPAQTLYMYDLDRTSSTLIQAPGDHSLVPAAQYLRVGHELPVTTHDDKRLLGFRTFNPSEGMMFREYHKATKEWRYTPKLTSTNAPREVITDVTISSDGKLMVAKSSVSPFMVLYELNAAGSFIPVTLPISTSSNIASAVISSSGNVIVVTYSTSPYLSVLERTSGSTFVLSTILTGVPKTPSHGACVSPDDQVVVVVTRGTEDPSIHKLRKTDVGWRGVSTAPTTGSSAVHIDVAVSPDGNRMVGWSSATTNAILYNYVLRPNGEFMLMDERVYATSIRHCLFSPDSKDLILLNTANASNNLVDVYRFDSNDQLVKLTDVPSIPTLAPGSGTGYKGCFIDDGKTLVITCTRFPYVVMMRQTATGYIRLDHENINGDTSDTAGFHVDPTGQRLILFGNRVRIYKRVVDQFIQELAPDLDTITNVTSAAFTPNGQSIIVGTSVTPFVHLCTLIGGVYALQAQPDVLPPSGVVGVSASATRVTLSTTAAPRIVEYTITPNKLTNFNAAQSSMTDEIPNGITIHVTNDHIIQFEGNTTTYRVYKIINGAYKLRRTAALPAPTSGPATVVSVDSARPVGVEPVVVVAMPSVFYVCDFDVADDRLVNVNTLPSFTGGASSSQIARCAISPDGTNVVIGRSYYRSSYQYPVSTTGLVLLTEHVRDPATKSFTSHRAMPTPTIWSTYVPPTVIGWYGTYYYRLDVSEISFANDVTLHVGVSYISQDRTTGTPDFRVCKYSRGTSWNLLSQQNGIGYGAITGMDSITNGAYNYIVLTSANGGTSNNASLYVLNGDTLATIHSRGLGTGTPLAAAWSIGHVKISPDGHVIGVSNTTMYGGHQMYRFTGSTLVDVNYTIGHSLYAIPGMCTFTPNNSLFGFFATISETGNHRFYEKESNTRYNLFGVSYKSLETLQLHGGSIVASVEGFTGVDILKRDGSGNLIRTDRSPALHVLTGATNVYVNHAGDKLVYSSAGVIGVVRIAADGTVTEILPRTTTLGSVKKHVHAAFIGAIDNVVIIGAGNNDLDYRIATCTFNPVTQTYSALVELGSSQTHSATPQSASTKRTRICTTVDGKYALTVPGAIPTPDTMLTMSELTPSSATVVYPLSIKLGTTIDVNAGLNAREFVIGSSSTNNLFRMDWTGVLLKLTNVIDIGVKVEAVKFERAGTHLVCTTGAVGTNWFRVDVEAGTKTSISGSPSFTYNVHFNNVGDRIVCTTQTGAFVFTYNAGVIGGLNNINQGSTAGRSVSHIPTLDTFICTTSNRTNQSLFEIDVGAAPRITHRVMVGDGVSPTMPKISATGDYLAVGVTGAPYVNVWYKGNLITPTANPATSGTIDYVIFSPDERVLIGAMNRVSSWTASQHTLIAQYSVDSTAVALVDSVNFESSVAAVGMAIDQVSNELIVQYSTDGIGIYPRVGDKYSFANTSTSPSWLKGVRANTNIVQVSHDSNGHLTVAYPTAIVKYRTNDSRGSYNRSPMFLSNVGNGTDFKQSPQGTSLLVRATTTVTPYKVVNFTTTLLTGATYTNINTNEYYQFMDEDRFITAINATGNPIVPSMINRSANTTTPLTLTWSPTTNLAPSGGLAVAPSGAVIYGINGINTLSPIVSMQLTGSQLIPTSQIRGDVYTWIKSAKAIRVVNDKMVAVSQGGELVAVNLTTNDSSFRQWYGSGHTTVHGLTANDKVFVLQTGANAQALARRWDVPGNVTVALTALSSSAASSGALAFNRDNTRLAWMSSNRNFVDVYSYNHNTVEFGSTPTSFPVSAWSTIYDAEWLSDDICLFSCGNALDGVGYISLSGASPIIDPALKLRSQVNKMSYDSKTGSVAFSNDQTKNLFGTTLGFLKRRSMVWGVEVPVESPPSAVRQIVMSPNKKWLAAANAYGHPFIWYRSGNRYNQLSRGTTPTIACTCVDIQANRLFVSSSVSQYAHVFELSPTANTATYLTALTPIPANASWIAASADGKTAVVAHNTYPFMSVFKEIGGTWTKLMEPDNPARAAGTSCSISADGVYLVITYAASPWLSIFKINPDNSISDIGGLQSISGARGATVGDTGHKVSFGYVAQ